MNLTLFDYCDVSPGGRIRYHHSSLPVGEWSAIDISRGRSRWSEDPTDETDPGLRRLRGNKVRNSIHTWGSVNGVPTSVEFKAPYEVLRVFVG